MIALCYYPDMGKKQSDLGWLRQNKKAVRFADLERILKRLGWKLQSTSGSHHVFSRRGSLPIMIVRPHGKHKYCHPMDVLKVIAELQKEEQANEQED